MKFVPIRVPAMAMAAAFCWLPMASAQSDQSANDSVTITVAVDGLTCSSSGQNSFTASAFAIEVNNTSSSGGAGGGAGKTIFSDLAIQKSFDTCSVPLFILAANGQFVKQVVLTETDKHHASNLTMTLEDVQIASSTLKTGLEVIDFSYAAITITDGAGHTTGRITPQSGSVPISLLRTADSTQLI